MKLALFGSALPTRNETPWDDPSWEIWTIATSLDVARRAGVVIELHREKEFLEGIRGRPDILYRKIEETGVREVLVHPDLMSYAHSGASWSVFPFDQTVAWSDWPYFTSSMPWMLAHAMRTRPDITTIGIYGVQFSRFPVTCDGILPGSIAVIPETLAFAFERSCMEFWLGRAMQRGIQIVLPKDCPLLRGPYLYGPEGIENLRALDLASERQRELMADRDRLLAESEAARLRRGQMLARLDERSYMPSGGPDQRSDMLRQEAEIASEVQQHCALALQDNATRLSETAYRVSTETLGPDPETVGRA